MSWAAAELERDAPESAAVASSFACFLEGVGGDGAGARACLARCEAARRGLLPMEEEVRRVDMH